LNPYPSNQARLCGPVVPWDWFIIDLSYVLVLIGGSMVFRAKNSGVGTWMAFGALSTFVGVILFTFTYQAQTAFAASAQAGDAIGMLAERC
jgi:hypothetical protein